MMVIQDDNRVSGALQQPSTTAMPHRVPREQKLPTICEAIIYGRAFNYSSDVVGILSGTRTAPATTWFPPPSESEGTTRIAASQPDGDCGVTAEGEIKESKKDEEGTAISLESL